MDHATQAPLTIKERDEIKVERLRALEERLLTDDALFLSMLAKRTNPVVNEPGEKYFHDRPVLTERGKLFDEAYAYAMCFDIPVVEGRTA